jgi:hypothetical protein
VKDYLPAFKTSREFSFISTKKLSRTIQNARADFFHGKDPDSFSGMGEHFFPRSRESGGIWRRAFKVEDGNFLLRIACRPGGLIEYQLGIQAGILPTSRPHEIPELLQRGMTSNHVHPIPHLKPSHKRQDFVGGKIEGMKRKPKDIISYQREKAKGAVPRFDSRGGDYGEDFSLECSKSHSFNLLA